MYSVGLYTLGCKVSQYETEALAELFASRGFAISEFSEVCDVYVVNTCTVTSSGISPFSMSVRQNSYSVSLAAGNPISISLNPT